mmetsp:Transcript_3378/g.7956  ORF Transcript_3378/g.7956 Transcript_3378/m.7956 type:complete len:212 (+) Transcript_3378:890-1525(+)
MPLFKSWMILAKSSAVLMSSMPNAKCSAPRSRSPPAILAPVTFCRTNSCASWAAVWLTAGSTLPMLSTHLEASSRVQEERPRTSTFCSISFSRLICTCTRTSPSRLGVNMTKKCPSLSMESSASVALSRHPSSRTCSTSASEGATFPNSSRNNPWTSTGNCTRLSSGHSTSHRDAFAAAGSTSITAFQIVLEPNTTLIGSASRARRMRARI